MIRGLHHVVVFCKDTALSKEWFERAGFEHLRGYEGMHWFALGDGEVMLHPGGNGKRGADPTIHLAVDDVRGQFQQLQAEGLEPFDHEDPDARLEGPVTRPWGDVEFSLRDPDGGLWAFTQVR